MFAAAGVTGVSGLESIGAASVTAEGPVGGATGAVSGASNTGAVGSTSGTVPTPEIAAGFPFSAVGTGAIGTGGGAVVAAEGIEGVFETTDRSGGSVPGSKFQGTTGAGLVAVGSALNGVAGVASGMTVRIFGVREESLTGAAPDRNLRESAGAQAVPAVEPGFVENLPAPGALCNSAVSRSNKNGRFSGQEEPSLALPSPDTAALGS